MTKDNGGPAFPVPNDAKRLPPGFKAFAALVIEAEHKRLLEESGEPNRFASERSGMHVYTADQLAAAVLKEREKCAKVCEEYDGSWYAQQCAVAIRGQA